MKNGSLVLTVDCGNSNIKFGVFSGDELVANYRVSTDSSKTSDEYAVLLRCLLESGGIDTKDFKGAILSSVVPPVQPFLERAIEKVLSYSCITVQPGIKTGVTINAENPKELGADLLCLSVGAVVRHTLPAVVVSLGTATAFVAVSSKPSITGVSIAPGILSAATSLSRTAAQLPQIELASPKTALGRNTTQSMRSGLVFGFAGLVDRICHEMSKEMEKQPIIIATGGLLNIISKTTTSITRFDPFLSMYGLKALYEKNVENR
ncbi:MAG TPA: type III pantothenate kinase [Caldisericia bacterium]|mgnify:CR=1 FL=1|nr:type III pantothenate kinase [Caldisericia bacterium]HPF48196.1 type III pantothenate kinase [Caldisericia bacterium]HPI83868.1 type III pantothenate kinase [Caldisericia bacterium]HPQ92649.1 type III pantothenate kinase [Caldisericia bacterium]HRV74253.1 type III pantothenate kinase [Caldisericia bacterium]